MRLGLALGGGGARGFAHLGVLRALSNANIKPSVISGTSMGAIIALGHVQEMTYPRMETKFKEFVLHFSEKFAGMNRIEAKSKEERGIFGDIIHSISKQMQMAAFAQKLTLSDGKLLEEIAEHFIYPCNLEELSIPVYIAALDMVSGKGVFLHKGNARKAAQAALSIAGYFPGIPLDGMELYDAQGVFPVPIQAMQFADVDVIIASSVDKNLMPQFQAANVVDLLFRQNEIAYFHVLGEVKNCSDVVIQPDLEDIHWTDFRKMETIVKLGFKAAQAALPDILDILNGKREVAPVQERAWHQWRMQDKEQFIITGFEPIKK